MTPPHDPNALLTAALRRSQAPLHESPARVLVVGVEAQHAWWFEGGRVVADWPVSTAAEGVGGRSGSFQTPPGWHRIQRRVGDGAALGAVFVSREPTGEVWNGETRGDDLILTRILTLDGVEDGINRGGDHDSLARFIYVHGTNQEEALGQPVSHGCVRLANRAMVELFDRVREGDWVVIVAPGPGEMPDPLAGGRFHYAGLGGSGMSALAQYQVMRGGVASGSDRGFDRGERPESREQLERLGIRVTPQDGSGIEGAAALVVSTAVEAQVPDVAAARRLELPVVHRSEMLAHWVAHTRSIAVSGTSGKSTVVAMVFEALRGAGRDPSVITGGDLVCLEDEGLWGNAWAGTSDLLVVEADESDGSLVRYRPAIGVALNLTRDHKTEAEVLGMFETLRGRTRERFVCGEDHALATLQAGALVFGTSERAHVRATSIVLHPDHSTFEVDGVPVRLPVPGRHNVDNALAAIAVGVALGVPVAELAAPLARFRGVGRRFQSLGSARGIEVIDDFAHNPAKIAAAIATAHQRAKRVLAVFQPHGYGPTRFLREDLVDTFCSQLRSGDRVWLLEVFYAGGSAVRDFSAADLVSDMADRGAAAEFAPSRAALLERLADAARPGDLVLVMGARDPSLTRFAGELLERLRATPASA